MPKRRGGAAASMRCGGFRRPAQSGVPRTRMWRGLRRATALCTRVDRFTRFIVKLARNKEANSRLFAAELCMRLLTELPDEEKGENEEKSKTKGTEKAATTSKEVPAKDSKAEEPLQAGWHSQLVAVLVQRSSDKIVTIRTKAITLLATAMEQAVENQHKKEFRKMMDEVFQKSVLQLACTEFSPRKAGESNVVEMLQRRADDVKSPLVRKAAIQALVALIAFVSTTENEAASAGAARLRESVEKLLVTHCCDVSVAVRKQCLASLTKLVFDGLTPRRSTMQCWLHAALPLVVDTEATVQQQAIDAVDEVLLQPITATKQSVATRRDYCLGVLDKLDGELLRCLQRACGIFVEKKRVTKQLVRGLANSLLSAPVATNKGGWVLFSELARVDTSWLDSDKILTCWNNVKDSQDFIQQHENIYEKLVTIVGFVAPSLPGRQCQELLRDYNTRLLTFSYPPLIIQAFMRCIPKIKNFDVGEWSSGLLKQCEQTLTEFVEAPHTLPAKAEHVIGWHLFTLGELSLVCPKYISLHLCTVIQTMIGATITTMSSNGGDDSGGEEKPTKQFIVPPSIRAQAFVTLGKMCLENPTLAKDSVALLAKELDNSTIPVIRNNVLVVLCDLCVRYTSLVGKFQRSMSLCLMDRSKFVRQQAVFLLTRLLQEAYLKWKGPLFFFYLRLTVDPDPILAQQATACLMSLVHGKESNSFYTYFVEAVFHFTGYVHAKYNQFGLPAALLAQPHCNLSGGGENRKKRMQIYTLMLSNMSAEHKLLSVDKLSTDVLSGVADGALPLPQAQDVLHDALMILSSKEIKVTAPTVVPEEAELEDTQQAKEAAVAQATGTFLSKIAKRNVLENVVPTAIELKHFFEKQHSPLLRNLMIFFKTLMQEYKQEMTEILTADKQLATELEYDLKQFTASQKSFVFQTPCLTPKKIQVKSFRHSHFHSHFRLRSCSPPNPPRLSETSQNSAPKWTRRGYARAQRARRRLRRRYPQHAGGAVLLLQCRLRQLRSASE
eukprot:TRINITY_DN5134_c0_g2_i5.p1 TRINITY_DN5134_c0_g2~~TRINITY_DN5134_c0_g2_i5.p1  ORF type:complete len:1008 (+),score=249.84 TRINITY_DN5134_c0_g2_i5:1158-4181(+)